MKLKDFAARLGEATRQMIEAAVQPLRAKQAELEAAVKAIPAGAPGARGEKGEPGKDADLEAVARMVDERVARELERRLAEIPRAKDGRDGQPGAPGPAGRDGEDGKDGRDGFGLEDFDVALEGRTLTVRFTRGELKVERQLRVPFPQDCGVYRPEAKYEKGDGVTFGGSYWLAQVDEPADKPGTSEQWRLAVKRGRDGKDAR